MNIRNGLRIRCEKGVNLEVRQVCINFCKWLRKELEIPIRVVIYLKKAYEIRNKTTNESVSATFFAPYDKNVEPYIRIATGDYEELVEERGRIDALYAILESIAHEVIHYQQWLKDLELDEYEAEIRGKKLVDKFAESLD